MKIGDRVQIIISKAEGVVTNVSEARVEVAFPKETCDPRSPGWWFDKNWVRKVNKKSKN